MFNILKIVDKFEKDKKNLDKHPDKKYIALKNSYDFAIMGYGMNHSITVAAKKALDNYEAPDQWELAVQENCRRAVMAMELKTRMTEACIEAGYLPRSAQTGVCRTMLITLTPPHNTLFKEFQLKCDQYLKRAFFVKYLAVYEQTGENQNDMGKGFHIHILTEVKHHKPKVIQDTKSTFKNMIDNAGIDVKLIRDISGWNNAVAYLTGSKLENPDKKASAELNVPWRQSLGISNEYTKEFSVPNKPENGTELKIEEI